MSCSILHENGHKTNSFTGDFSGPHQTDEPVGEPSTGTSRGEPYTNFDAEAAGEFGHPVGETRPTDGVIIRRWQRPTEEVDGWFPSLTARREIWRQPQIEIWQADDDIAEGKWTDKGHWVAKDHGDPYRSADDVADSLTLRCLTIGELGSIIELETRCGETGETDWQTFAVGMPTPGNEARLIANWQGNLVADTGEDSKAWLTADERAHVNGRGKAFRPLAVLNPRNLATNLAKLASLAKGGKGGNALLAGRPDIRQGLLFDLLPICEVGADAVLFAPGASAKTALACALAIVWLLDDERNGFVYANSELGRGDDILHRLYELAAGLGVTDDALTDRGWYLPEMASLVDGWRHLDEAVNGLAEAGVNNMLLIVDSTTTAFGNVNDLGDTNMYFNLLASIRKGMAKNGKRLTTVSCHHQAKSERTRKAEDRDPFGSVGWTHRPTLTVTSQPRPELAANWLADWRGDLTVDRPPSLFEIIIRKANNVSQSQAEADFGAARERENEACRFDWKRSGFGFGFAPDGGLRFEHYDSRSWHEARLIGEDRKAEASEAKAAAKAAALDDEIAELAGKICEALATHGEVVSRSRLAQLLGVSRDGSRFSQAVGSLVDDGRLVETSAQGGATLFGLSDWPVVAGEDWADRICDALAMHGESPSRSQLADLVGLNRDSKRFCEAVARLVADGRVVEVPLVKASGKPHASRKVLRLATQPTTAEEED